MHPYLEETPFLAGMVQLLQFWLHAISGKQSSGSRWWGYEVKEFEKYSGMRMEGLVQDAGIVVGQWWVSPLPEGTNRELPRLAASPGSSMYSWEWDLWRENLRLIGLASNVSHLPLEAQIHEDHDLGVINMYMEIRGYDTDLEEVWQRINGGHIIEYRSGWWKKGSNWNTSCG